MAVRRQTFRLYPNKAQERALFDVRRQHCYLYNAAVSERKTMWKRWGISVDYFAQQNCLPGFKAEWPEFKALGSQAIQATLKRVDFAYQRFFKGLGGLPKFKSIRKYSGWTYPAKSGWTAHTEGTHGYLELLGVKVKMRGKAKQWGVPTTCTIVYKPGQNAWYASITVNVADPVVRFGSDSELTYESMVAYDLGTETALTLFDGSEFVELENPRFSRETDKKARKVAKAKRRKRNPAKGQKASRRWKKANRREAKLRAKAARQRKDWQHKVTSDIASRYDIGVTEKLNTKGMTRKAKKGSKRKRQKAGLNREILSVGFGTINKMMTYKIEQKGGLALFLPTQKVKPSQRCPNCGKVHKHWAELSNRYHICDGCGFEIPRDRGSVVVMHNVATNNQPGLGNFSLVSLGCLSSTSENRKHTGGMKQLGQAKRQKSHRKMGSVETPSVYTVG